MKKIAVLVVGGGNVAYHKVKILSPYTNKIKIVAPKINSLLKAIISKGDRMSSSCGGQDVIEQGNELIYIQKEFQLQDLKEIGLCIAATNSLEINKIIVAECERVNILCNSVSDPEEGHITFPAFFKTGDLMISVSTGGKSPTLARKIKEELHNQYSDRYSNLLQLLGEIREEYNAKIPSESRKIFWNDVIELCLDGRMYESGDISTQKSEKRLSTHLKKQIKILSKKYYI